VRTEFSVMSAQQQELESVLSQRGKYKDQAKHGMRSSHGLGACHGLPVGVI
jgi:hypothetical protein